MENSREYKSNTPTRNRDMYSVSGSSSALAKGCFLFFLKRREVSLTPDGQVVYVHLVPVVILYGIDKGVPFGFVQVNFTVCRLHDFNYRDDKTPHYLW